MDDQPHQCGKEACMATSPRTYLFDLYGVIMKVEGPAQFERVNRVIGEPGKTELLHEVYRELRPDLNAGRITEISYWNQVQARVGLLDFDFGEAMAADYAGISEMDEQVKAFVDELKARGHRIGVLSNIPQGVAKKLRDVHGDWLNSLDAVLFSSEIDTAKPDPKAYELAIEALGVPASEITFIDDRQVNVEAAREAGMNAIHYSTLDALKAELP